MSSTTETKRIKDPDFQKKESYWLRLLRNANWSKLIGSNWKNWEKESKIDKRYVERKRKKEQPEKEKNSP